MKPVPRDPSGLAARIMDAVIGDILDVNAKGTPRSDALRAVLKAKERGQ